MSSSVQQTAQVCSHAQVPRSAKMVTEDNEYVLYSFILFRKIVDSYKSEARQKGWQVSSPVQGCLPYCVPKVLQDQA